MTKRFDSYVKRVFSNSQTTIIAGVLVATVIFVGSTHAAHADGLFGFPDLWSILSRIIAYVVNVVLAVSSWYVALMGTLLNVSINLTMHIKDFVDSTPAIYDVWRAIRDISGMFIIFGLLYASIRMILGQDAKLGSLIKNIVIAGVLINFSFFITGVLIDASNIVSLQLYRAMTPGQPDIGNLINNKDPAASGLLPGIVNKVFSDGGLSMVFMQSLQIQTAFNPKNLNLDNPDPSASFSTPFRIVIIGITGIVIMVTAGLSFMFASLAFVVRLIILLILLAFSPIWFAAAVIPQLKEYADEWWKVFKAQLIFMPAYLLFMYVALRIITNSNLFNTGAYATLWKGSATGALIPTEFIAFGINAALIIVMLNIPLLAAIKLGASTGKLLDGKKLGADAIWGKVGGWARNSAYQNTISRGASAISRSESLRNWASRSAVGELAFKGIKSGAKNYDEKLAKQVQERTSFASSLGSDKRASNTLREEQRQLRMQQAQLRAANNTAAADALNPRIQAIDIQLTQEETRRQRNYARRTDTHQMDTLWTKVARKDRLAANKLQMEALRRQLTQRQQNLQRAQDRVNNMQNNIDTLESQIQSGQVRNLQQAQGRLAQLRQDLPNAHARVAPLMQDVHDLERRIEEMEVYS